MESSTMPLQQQLQALLPKIVSHPYLPTASKHTKIRINSWLARLSLIICNNTWRKNRNNYMRLLYVMMECGEILEPFTAIAPEDLPTLHRHQINCILLKINTRLKEREKENKEGRGTSRLNAYQIWSGQQEGTKITNSNTRGSTIGQNVLKVQLKDNFNSLGMDYLSPISPISQGVHARTNSSLSECTYNSIEKYRDMLAGQDCTHEGRPVFGDCGNLDIGIGIGIGRDEETRDGVKYFRNNRKRQMMVSSAKQKVDENKQDFYHRLLAFLKKHKANLDQDQQYAQVLQSVQEFLQTGPEPAQPRPQESPANTNGQRQGYADFYPAKIEQIKEEQNFSLAEIDQNSYDYISGKYSQYSSIQPDCGIPASRIKFLTEQPEEQPKKVITEIPEGISSFRKGIKVEQSARSRQRKEQVL